LAGARAGKFCPRAAGGGDDDPLGAVAKFGVGGAEIDHQVAVHLSDADHGGRRERVEDQLGRRAGLHAGRAGDDLRADHRIDDDIGRDFPPGFGGTGDEGGPRSALAGSRERAGGGTNAVEPAILLAASDSISGGGLFVDYKPWIVVVTGAILISILFWIPLTDIGLPLHSPLSTRKTDFDFSSDLSLR